MGPHHARRGEVRPTLPVAPLRMRGQAQRLSLRATWRGSRRAFCAVPAPVAQRYLRGLGWPPSLLLSYLCVAAALFDAVSRRRDPQSRVPSRDRLLRHATKGFRRCRQTLSNNSLHVCGLGRTTTNNTSNRPVLRFPLLSTGAPAPARCAASARPAPCSRSGGALETLVFLHKLC